MYVGDIARKWANIDTTVDISIFYIVKPFRCQKPKIVQDFAQGKIIRRCLLLLPLYIIYLKTTRPDDNQGKMQEICKETVTPYERRGPRAVLHRRSVARWWSETPLGISRGMEMKLSFYVRYYSFGAHSVPLQGKGLLTSRDANLKGIFAVLTLLSTLHCTFAKFYW